MRARWAAALVAGLLLMTACSSGPPPLAASALAAAATDGITTVYVVPVSEGCAGAFVSGVAAGPDGIVVSENTCDAEAGGDDSTPHSRLLRLTDDGETVELTLPEGVDHEDGIVVRAITDDGAVYVTTQRETTHSLWRLTDGRWSLVTRPSDFEAGHAGDGGPAEQATLDEVLAVEPAPDGSLLVLEPHAVRRIGVDGRISTVAGSDRNDPPGMLEYLPWGSGGLHHVVPDPRLLPSEPAAATDTALPRLTAIAAADDGSVWLASHDTVLHLGVDGTLSVHADAATVEAAGPEAALVGSRGSSSSIAALLADGDGLLLVDSWSSRLLRLEGRHMELVAGRPEEQRASCPEASLAATVDATKVCATSLDRRPGGDLVVEQGDSVLLVPHDLLLGQEPA